jgi:single-stranded DNA-specific DHH superfamily exonuclease
MNPTVTIHSDADGVTRTITLIKTGADMGHITIASTAAPGSDQNYDVKNVRRGACRGEGLTAR